MSWRPNLKNGSDSATWQSVVEQAANQPAHRRVRASNELRNRGVFESLTGVRGVWIRHGFAKVRDRLEALEGKVAAEGLSLTEAQARALELRRHDDEAAGEI